jgi:hypothetical protein
VKYNDLKETGASYDKLAAEARNVIESTIDYVGEIIELDEASMDRLSNDTCTITFQIDQVINWYKEQSTISGQDAIASLFNKSSGSNIVPFGSEAIWQSLEGIDFCHPDNLLVKLYPYQKGSHGDRNILSKSLHDFVTARIELEEFMAATDSRELGYGDLISSYSRRSKSWGHEGRIPALKRLLAHQKCALLELDDLLSDDDFNGSHDAASDPLRYVRQKGAVTYNNINDNYDSSGYYELAGPGL